MKKCMFFMFSVLTFAASSLSAQTACCTSIDDCKPEICCPDDPTCCTPDNECKPEECCPDNPNCCTETAESEVPQSENTATIKEGLREEKSTVKSTAKKKG